MSLTLTDIIRNALLTARDRGELAFGDLPAIVLESPKQAEHGDVATPVAMTLARAAKKPPRDIARILTTHLDCPAALVSRVEIAGPGYINFHLTPSYWTGQLADIVTRGAAYGTHDWGNGEKVMVEFVSANPTGPLHVGHGRGAVVGDVIARLLAAVGAQVHREYYVNDVGNQMNILGRSTYIRYAELLGARKDVPFPDEHYRGEYIRDIAELIKKEDGDIHLNQPEETWLPRFTRFAHEHILTQIRDELTGFGIRFDRWFSERELYQGTPSPVEQALEQLRRDGYLYEQDGAKWLATMQKGDDKDRVLVRSNGVTTYFASDVAYHRNKFERGFTRLIDVWGADHHGYIARLAAAIGMLGHNPEAFTVQLVQLVSLVREGVPVSMSTRAGTFETLADVTGEIGVDATRFFFLLRRSDAHLEFDLALAKAQTSENPVFYIQYAHARVCQLMAKARDAGIDVSDLENHRVPENLDLAALQDAETLALIKFLVTYPEMVDLSARELGVHRLPYFLQDLASRFHAYYYKHRFITDDIPLSRARLILAAAVGQVIKNGLGLLGVSAPDRM